MAMVINGKCFNNEAFHSTMPQAWKVEEGISFIEVGENKFIMEFKNITNKKKVLQERPWNLNRFLIVVQDVDGSLPPNAVIFTHESFWVQLHNVP